MIKVEQPQSLSDHFQLWGDSTGQLVVKLQASKTDLWSSLQRHTVTKHYTIKIITNSNNHNKIENSHRQKVSVPAGPEFYNRNHK